MAPVVVVVVVAAAAVAVGSTMRRRVLRMVGGVGGGGGGVGVRVGVCLYGERIVAVACRDVGLVVDPCDLVASRVDARRPTCRRTREREDQIFAGASQ